MQKGSTLAMSEDGEPLREASARLRAHATRATLRS